MTAYFRSREGHPSHDEPSGPAGRISAVRRREHCHERKGWFYALAGLSQFDVHFYTVLTPLRTSMPAPETVADVAEHLVRFRRITESEYGEPWEGAGDVQVAANDFRRARLGLPPLGRQRPEGFGKGK